MQPCIFAKIPYILSAVNVDISFADQMGKRHFDRIAEPTHSSRIHRHIPQDEPAARPKYTINAVEEILRIRVMMKALTADHGIK